MRTPYLEMTWITGGLWERHEMQAGMCLKQRHANGSLPSHIKKASSIKARECTHRSRLKDDEETQTVPSKNGHDWTARAMSVLQPLLPVE